jgi:hypothetical protein
VTSKFGRPSGRPRPRSSIVGHPGAFPEKGEPSKAAQGNPRDLETGTTVGSSEVARVDRGASWCVSGEDDPVFSSSPRAPLLHNAAQEQWPIDADAPWKSYGRLRGTARTEPSTAFSTELGKPANGCRFSTSVNRPAALRRVASARLSLHYEPRTQSMESDTGSTINPSTETGQGQSASCGCYAACWHVYLVDGVAGSKRRASSAVSCSRHSN